MKKRLKDYLSFTKGEIIALLLFAILIVFLIFYPFFFGSKNTDLKLATLPKTVDSIRVSPQKPKPTNAISFFNFNPNTLDKEGWLSLGVPDKVVQTIFNYRSKGGKFYKPTDLKKIYGLSPKLADQLIPYVELQAVAKNNAYAPKTATNSLSSGQLDLNSVEALDLLKLNFLPKNICYRILSYREKLGGYYAKEQLLEVYGITDSLYQKLAPIISIDSKKIELLDLNKCPDYVFYKHPYFQKNIGKSILVYRTQYGNFKTIEEIKKIPYIQENTYQKLRPYLTIAP